MHFVLRNEAELLHDMIIPCSNPHTYRAGGSHTERNDEQNAYAYMYIAWNINYLTFVSIDFFDALSFITVSYTHLTLPTKRIV